MRAKQLPRPFGAGGIGIELGDHAGFAIGGIDLDTCRAETGELAPWALEVVGRFGSYTEVSPSGTGAKVFFLFDATDLPALRAIMGTEHGKQFKRKGHGDHPPAIELYLGNRYFAVTDQPLDSSPAELRHVDASTLRWLLTEAGPAFATGAAPGQEKPLTRSGERQTGDSSRSAAAFKIANDVKRAGGAYPDFLAALDTMSDTAAWKAEKGSANGGRELRRTWERAAVNDDELLTESSVADRFAAQAVNRLRYCHDAGSWYEWTGTHWRADRKHEAFTYARRLTGDLAQRAEAKVQAITGKAAFCGGVEKFAQRDERLAVTAEDWDRHPFLLATPDGTVDLHTGQLRPALQADMMTRVAAVAPAEPGTEAPLWRAFLLQATKGDYQLIGFLKRWAGYCLTGDTREHALLFGYGPGGNGKSVFLNTVARIMGDYAAVAAMDTFTATQGDKHPTDLAMLRGARLVTATETEEGRAWAESRIKQMTGGDPISARFMRQDFFTFRPQFKLTIVGNHKPVLRNVDEAARRRFNIVPFLHRPEQPDTELEAKLQAEWPAILRWMIDGCLAWQTDGLVRPKAVQDETAAYFEAQDHFGRWLAECCALDSVASTRPGQLLTSFNEWCESAGETVADNRRLRGMIERVPGLRYATVKGYPFVRGLRLLTPDERRGLQREAEQAQRGDCRQGEGVRGGEGSNP